MNYEDLMKISGNTLEMLNKGAFLLTQDGDKKNAMIISWGLIGKMWEKPVMMVMLRHQHYTHQLLENNKEFTVTFADPEVVKEAWEVCGKKSGKAVDKFEEFKKIGLNTIAGKEVNVPVLDTPSRHFECKVLFETNVNLENMPKDILDEFYPEGNSHTLYFAEIVAEYETK